MLVGFTLLVVWGGSTELVITIVDDGNIVDLVTSSVTVDIHKLSSCTSIRYGCIHTFSYKHTHMYHVIFLLFMKRCILATVYKEMLTFFSVKLKRNYQFSYNHSNVSTASLSSLFVTFNYFSILGNCNP